MTAVPGHPPNCLCRDCFVPGIAGASARRVVVRAPPAATGPVVELRDVSTDTRVMVGYGPSIERLLAHGGPIEIDGNPYRALRCYVGVTTNGAGAATAHVIVEVEPGAPAPPAEDDAG